MTGSTGLCKMSELDYFFFCTLCVDMMDLSSDVRFFDLSVGA